MPRSVLSSGPASALRLGNLDDVSAIVALTNLAFLAEAFCVIGDRTNAADVLQRMQTGVFYVIAGSADADRLTGSVFCSVNGERGYLGLLSVHPDAQGTGLSHHLIEAATQHCRLAGCTVLDITVVDVRTDLIGFYAKRGFAMNGEIPFPMPERAKQPLRLVKMVKALRIPS